MFRSHTYIWNVAIFEMNVFRNVAKLGFSHPKYYKYALPLFLIFHLTMMTWSHRDVILLCLRSFSYLNYLLFDVFLFE